MKITCLIENTGISPELEVEHGLSIHIRQEHRQMLFDFGATDSYAQNAQRLGLDLREVDIGVLSHGHYDHGGGLEHFLSINDKANVYLNKKAMDKHLSQRENGIEYIGLKDSFVRDRSRWQHRLVLTEERFKIDPKTFLFSDIREKVLYPKGNQFMLNQSEDGNLILDDFSHEQNLIVQEDGRSYLFAGCAHRGILNILRRAEEHLGKMPEVVVGGFHLSLRRKGHSETKENIRKLAVELSKTGATFFTGHCTGQEPFNLLHESMGDKMKSISTGQVIEC